MKNYNINRDDLGRYTTKLTWKDKLKYFLLGALIVFVGYNFVTHYFKAREIMQNIPVTATSTEQAANCLPVGNNEFDCSDLKVTAKLAAYNASKLSQATSELAKYGKDQMQTLTEVCRANKQDVVECPKVLAAMIRVESVNGKYMIGDHGHSLGWYHILDVHKDMPDTCKIDLWCSSMWVLKRIVHYGFNSANGNINWKSVAVHNSLTPKWNLKYQGMVKKAFAKL